MKFIKSSLKKFFFIFIRFYAKAKNPKVVFNPQEVTEVLVYAYTGLGNFIMYTAALKAIKNFLPQARFVLLHGNDTGCHEVVTGSNLFDEYIVVKRDANWWTRIKWISRIRKRKFNLIISEFHNNNSFMALLTILSGAKYRLGHISSPDWQNCWDFIYNIPVKMKKNQHEVERCLELAYALGLQERDINKSSFIHIEETDRAFAKSFLTSNNINAKKKIISIQIGTSPTMRWKQWNLDKYKKLCDMILKLPNTKVILHGSPTEVYMINGVAAKMNNKPIIAAGKTTIKQAAALLEKSDILICNDSGLMHIAVAVDVPVIAIYGPTDYMRTAPLGEKHTIIRKDLNCSPCFNITFNKDKNALNCPNNHECLKSITVDEVFEIVAKKLRGD